MARPDDDMPRHDDPTELEPRPRPPPSPDHSRTSTTAQLRQDIDSGATGDKVPALDPAASPVGTDDEAAGAPQDPKAVAAERRAERERPPPPPHAFDHGGTRLGLGVGGAALLGVALAVIALWISLAG
ncbi:MAG: hypothetical protein IRZ13_10215 [Acetobacteraceae bacterium]|nr:hypothetical protein [Acetobacteraceae bacterium]